MLKRLFFVLVGCIAFTGCQILSKQDVQEKIVKAAKDAVVNVAYKKIDAREDLSPSMKTFLKEFARKFIDDAFERLKDEYAKKTQQEIEDDMNALVEKSVENVYGSYLESHK